MTNTKIILRFIYGMFLFISGAAAIGLWVEDIRNNGFSWLAVFFIVAALGCAWFGMSKIDNAIR